MKLFEILVPDIPHFHKFWDEKVIAIVGGLTIAQKVKGKWLTETDRLVTVRIACNDEQMVEIAKMTCKLYSQQAVMYYVISNETFIVSVA